MKNFSVTDAETGEEHWISRSIAVAVVIIPWSGPEGNPKFLVSKRGKGCPDHIGKWQCTCGYLDFDETLEEAMIREVREELGLNIKKALEEGKANILLWKIIDDPSKDARQNVVFRYLVQIDENWLQKEIESGVINTETDKRGGEILEVEEIKIISPEEIDAMDWAFNHGEILKSLINTEEKVND